MRIQTSSWKGLEWFCSPRVKGEATLSFGKGAVAIASDRTKTVGLLG
jgi:hypothetical protein